MSLGVEIKRRRRRLRLSGEVLVGAAVGTAVAATYGAGAGEASQVTAWLAAASAISAACGTVILIRAHDNAPDGALMAMRDKAAMAEAKLGEIEALQDEIEERAQCADMVIRVMAEEIDREAIEPSEIDRALRYLADPDARLKRPFGPWPRDASQIALNREGKP